MNFIDRVTATEVRKSHEAIGFRTPAETRAESHVKVLTISPGTLNEKIINYLKPRAGVSRAVIANELAIRESSLCGRLHELVGAGYVHVGPTMYNTDTKRNVVTYWVIPVPPTVQEGNVRMALLGENLVVGIAGFGVNDAEALANFRTEYMARRSGMCRG